MIQDIQTSDLDFSLQISRLQNYNIKSNPVLSRQSRLPPAISFVRNKLLYKVYDVRHRHHQLVLLYQCT